MSDDSPLIEMSDKDLGISDEDKSKTPEFEPESPDYPFDKPPGEEVVEPESPDYSFDKPPEQEDFEPVSPDYSFDGPPKQQEEEESVPPQKTPDLSPSPSKNSEAVTAAVIRYYKLKGDYDKKYNNAKKKITKSGVDLNQIRKKLRSMQMKCINCKQNGGTIFTNKDSILTAKCGNTESPCGLDIQIKRGKWMLLPKAAELSRTNIKHTKAEIIDLKLDLLFGLRTEEQIAADFDNEKRDYKTFAKQLDMIEGVIDSENKISIAGPTKGEDSVRRISIDEYINIKKRQLKNHVSTFKSLVKEYMEEDDVVTKQDLMKRAINIYTEDIMPIMKNMRESKYAVTMMDTTEERGMFIMKQVKVLLQNLDFEYEFGEIISDKK